MSRQLQRVVIVTHSDPEVARQVVAQTLSICSSAGVKILAPQAEFEKHAELLSGAHVGLLSDETAFADHSSLCLVLGGDGTMLRAFHLMQRRSIPVAGVNLGKVGFLTTVDKDQVVSGLERLLAGDFREYPLLSLEATSEGETFYAANDVVVNKGDRATACSLALTINGLTLFEVSCDGVVAGTPAGSSAYSLAAGGPLLGISVDAYVISLVAAHAVGVRPVVAGADDVLEIINTDERPCYVDIDGQRVKQLPPGAVVSVRAVSGMNDLALLQGDSLYHHFRDRLL